MILELVAAATERRRDVRPRGHRGGVYPFLRATMCVVVRDLIVYGVLTDMMKGRPAVYATFSSYDEVAHHSGLEREDTLEALRKLDQQFGRIERARRYAPRPYEIVVLSDHGQTQGATFKQRNGYGLDDLVKRIARPAAASASSLGGDEKTRWSAARCRGDAGGRRSRRRTTYRGRDAVVLGSGNLGLVYLMEEPRRLTLEEIEERHPKLIPAVRAHPHVGCRARALGGARAGRARRRGAHYLDEGAVEGEDPLAHFSPNAARHLLRTDGFAARAGPDGQQLLRPALDEGCAFEELISFHGGLGGTQTRPFMLHPARCRAPAEPIVGAEAVHAVLTGWRRALQAAVTAAGERGAPRVTWSWRANEQRSSSCHGARPDGGTKRLRGSRARGGAGREQTPGDVVVFTRLVAARRHQRGRADAGRVARPRGRARRRADGACTAENAARTLPLLLERAVGRAVVVCAPLHVYRTRLLLQAALRRLGIDVGVRVAPTRPQRRRDRVGARGAAVPAGASCARHRRSSHGVRA